MQYLAFYLSQEIGQPVVDQTGLKGHYDFSVKWANNGSAAMPPPPPPGASTDNECRPSPPSGLSIFEALPRQLHAAR
jgi:uncharacterized protein (TIGR03435 family)